MKKTAFRNLVISFFALIFLSHSYAQRWVPEDDFNHIKTFCLCLEEHMLRLPCYLIASSMLLRTEKMRLEKLRNLPKFQPVIR